MEEAIVRWALVISAFLILWFLALFVLLPMGLSETDDQPGVFVPGAPVVPAKPPKISLRTKFLWATYIATGGWLFLAALVWAGVLHL